MKRTGFQVMILAVAALSIAAMAWAQPGPRISRADFTDYYADGGGHGGDELPLLPPREGDGEGGEGDFERPPFPPPPPHHSDGPRGDIGAVLQKLQNFCRFWEDENLVEKMELSEEQIAALEESFIATKEALEATSGTLKTAGMELRESVEAPDNPDLTEVNGNIDAFTAALNEKMRIFIGHRVVVNTVLTQEQEDILREYRCHRRPGHQVRDRVHMFQQMIRGLASDGELSEEDWAIINEKLSVLPEDLADSIRERIENHFNNGDGAGHEARRPDRPEQGQFRSRRSR